MADPDILTLPPNRPDLWGRTINRLAEQVLPPGENPRAALPRLSAFLTGGSDRYYSSLYQWVLHGKLDAKGKQLSAEYWLDITRFFWRVSGGVTCREEVEALVRCGGPHLEKITEEKRADFDRLLASPWADIALFDPLQAALPADPNYLPPGFLLERPELAEILDYIKNGWYQDQPVVITGLPGIGKTTLLMQLLAERRPLIDLGGEKLPLREYFHAGVLYLPFNQGLSDDLILRDLARQAGLYVPLSLPSDADLLYQLRDRLSGGFRILLLDGIADVEAARRLTVVDYTHNLVIITTPYVDIAKGLTSDEMIVTLAGFEEEEACVLYEKSRHRKLSAQDRQYVAQMKQALDGNPAALSAAFRLTGEYGLEETLSLIVHPAHEPLVGRLGAIFKPKALAYQRLRADIYRLRLAALARLNQSNSSIHEEIIAAIWDVELSVARCVLATLQEETGLVQCEAADESAWRVKAVAGSLAYQSPLAILAGWRERALKTSYMGNYVKGKRDEAAKWPFIQGIQAYFEELKLRGQPVLWKIWKLLTDPDFVPQQAASEAQMQGRPIQETLHVEHLAETERKGRRLEAWVLRLALLTSFLLLALRIYLFCDPILPVAWQAVVRRSVVALALFGFGVAVWLAWRAWRVDRLHDFQWMLWRRHKRPDDLEPPDLPD